MWVEHVVLTAYVTPFSGLTGRLSMSQTVLHLVTASSDCFNTGYPWLWVSLVGVGYSCCLHILPFPILCPPTVGRLGLSNLV